MTRLVGAELDLVPIQRWWRPPPPQKEPPEHLWGHRQISIGYFRPVARPFARHELPRRLALRERLAHRKLSWEVSRYCSHSTRRIHPSLPTASYSRQRHASRSSD